MTIASYARRSAEALGPTTRGILWMVLCGLSFALLNALTRIVTADLHPWQTQFLRYCFGGAVILPFLLRGGLHLLRTKNLRLQIGRNLVHTVASGLWFLALPLVPLAEITAISFTGPIFMTIGAMLFFRETVRARRWIAIALGFFGILIVLYPKLQLGISASSASLLLLVAAPVSACSYLIAKVLMRQDQPETIVLWQALLVSLFTLPFALWFWQPVADMHLVLFVLAGILGSTGHYALNRSLKAADISATQPTRFLELVWASALGALIWGDVPPVWTFVGAIVIFGSTTYIARREAIADRDRRLSEPPAAA